MNDGAEPSRGLVNENQPIPPITQYNQPQKVPSKRSKGGFRSRANLKIEDDMLNFDPLNIKWKGRDHLFDYPLMTDGYYYREAEPDPIVYPNVNWDQYINKPFPKEAFRLIKENYFQLSSCDKAPNLIYSPKTQTVTGNKGYSAIRSNYGISCGSWYYEVKISSVTSPDACARIGFSQLYASYNYPCGYDKFGYSLRTLHGTKFHDSVGKSYSECSTTFNEGDILGCHIFIPYNQKTLIDENYVLSKSAKQPVLINFKEKQFFEYMFKTSDLEKELKTLPHSTITFFKNGISQGVAFQNLYEGMYFPTLSLFGSSSVIVNFGPKFHFMSLINIQSLQPFYYAYQHDYLLHQHHMLMLQTNYNPPFDPYRQHNYNYP